MEQDPIQLHTESDELSSPEQLEHDNDRPESILSFAEIYELTFEQQKVVLVEYRTRVSADSKTLIDVNIFESSVQKEIAKREQRLADLQLQMKPVYEEKGVLDIDTLKGTNPMSYAKYNKLQPIIDAIKAQITKFQTYKIGIDARRNELLAEIYWLDLAISLLEDLTVDIIDASPQHPHMLS